MPELNRQSIPTDLPLEEAEEGKSLEDCDPAISSVHETELKTSSLPATVQTMQSSAEAPTKISSETTQKKKSPEQILEELMGGQKLW